MATNELLNKIEALNEWEALMEECKAEIESLRDSLKQEMLDTIVTNRFDNSSFKKQMPDVYNSFIRQTTSKRFSIN